MQMLEEKPRGCAGWALVSLLTRLGKLDGVTSTLSDAEIVDVARGAPDPHAAAAAIVSLAEELGSEDNATALVVPLAGWGNTTGADKTLELRNYRKKMMIGNERQRRT
ncbi:hypothetical protein FRC06_004043 [Ceratobasidium sp. 370]|nr:hypothetical protein FRC06_004043 [Ceratobasidium sp. 370]